MEEGMAIARMGLGGRGASPSPETVQGNSYGARGGKAGGGGAPALEKTPGGPGVESALGVSGAEEEQGTKAERGEPIFMEHLPFPRLATGLLKGSTCLEGVLLVLYSCGAACFCPLTERTVNANPAAGGARLLTPDAKPRGQARSERSEAQRYQLYETVVAEEDVVDVHRFSFLQEAGGGLRRPQRILLSADRRLLLLFGVQHKGQSCAVVYQILDHGSERFRPVFYDLTLSLHDACFTPDSCGLLAVPRAHEGVVLFVRVPRVTDDAAIVGARRNGGARGPRQPRAKEIQFEPRVAGPLCVFGPAVGCLGKTLSVRHIAGDDCTLHFSGTGDGSATVAHSKSYFSFVTWNDECIGEFCVWTVEMLPGCELVYSCEPRLLNPIADVNWLLEPDAPKQQILECQFCERGEFLGVMVQRRQFAKTVHNGIGLCMVTALPASFDHGEAAADVSGWYYKTKTRTKVTPGGKVATARSTDLSLAAAALVAEEVAKLAGTYQGSSGSLGPPLFCAAPCWYKVSDQLHGRDSVVCLKWTDTLVLGSLPAFAAVVKGRGLFEMVEYMYGTSFQDLADDFAKSVRNFVQIGKYHRFWVSATGQIRSFVVTPQLTSTHPEWADLFACSQGEIMERRVLGRRFGYFISNVESDAPATLLQQAYTQSRGKAARREAKNSVSEGQDIVIAGSKRHCARMEGLHLYRCWACKRTLLKPLQCSRCKSVCYCSDNCQRLHWRVHKQVCTEGGLFFPHQSVN